MKPKSGATKKIITRLDVISSMSNEPNATDVQGSWTGTPTDGGEPVQDADDL